VAQTGCTTGTKASYWFDRRDEKTFARCPVPRRGNAVGETYGTGALESLSALAGPNRSAPSEPAKWVAARCAGGRHKSVPLPTATECQPLRGSDGDRQGSQAKVKGNRLRGGPTHQATRFAEGVRISAQGSVKVMGVAYRHGHKCITGEVTPHPPPCGPPSPQGRGCPTEEGR